MGLLLQTLHATINLTAATGHLWTEVQRLKWRDKLKAKFIEDPDAVFVALKVNPKKNRTQVPRLIQGDRPPSKKTAVRLSPLLDVPVAEILGAYPSNDCSSSPQFEFEVPGDLFEKASELLEKSRRLLSSLKPDLLKVPGASVVSKVLENGETIGADEFEQFRQALSQLLTVQDKVLKDVALEYGVSYDTVAQSFQASRSRALSDIEGRFRAACDVDQLIPLREKMLDCLRMLRKAQQANPRYDFLLAEFEDKAPILALYASAFESLQEALKQPLLREPYRGANRCHRPIRLARHAEALGKLYGRDLDPLSAIPERLSTCERIWLETMTPEERRQEATRAVALKRGRGKTQSPASIALPDYWERQR
ncbi:MAG: hypothetical protein U0931_15060 [Vulcanimicrobiota bacterium]